MARVHKVLNALDKDAINKLKPAARPYKANDGRGLFLLVSPDGSKQWRFKYTFAGKEKGLKVGDWPRMTPTAARDACDVYRQQLLEGDDPSALRKAGKVKATAEAALVERVDGIPVTFGEWAEAYCLSNETAEHGGRAAWGRKTASATRQIIRDHLFPTLRDKVMTEITSVDIAAQLRRVKSPTVRWFARMRASLIFQYAIAAEATNVEIDPAAALKTNPKLGDRSNGKNNKSLAQEDLPAFLVALDEHQDDGIAKPFTKLLMLTFVRTNELRQIKWRDVDFDGGLFATDSGPMLVIRKDIIKQTKAVKKGKAGDHLVPLAPQAVAILRALPQGKPGDYVFPSRRASKMKGHMGCVAHSIAWRLLGEMGYRDAMSGHGFRSLAKTILSEQHDGDGEEKFAERHLETQLSHVPPVIIGTYSRAKFIVHRERIMREWANLIDMYRARGHGKNVTKMKRAA